MKDDSDRLKCITCLTERFVSVVRGNFIRHPVLVTSCQTKSGVISSIKEVLSYIVEYFISKNAIWCFKKKEKYLKNQRKFKSKIFSA